MGKKIKQTLDEGRILVIGTQILVGFQFRAAFEQGFERLPPITQKMELVGLILLLCAFCLLLLPACYQVIVERGEDTAPLLRFANRVMGASLLPFALSIGIDLFTTTERLLSTISALVVGVVASAFCLVCWYGLELVRREKEPEMPKDEGGGNGGTKISDKISQILTEARMVLPGAQALLGFQFVTFLMDAFDKLPEFARYVHLASLIAVAISVTLLMMPPAYHRLVEGGEDTQEFYDFASKAVLGAMVPLALGITGDVFVVFIKVTDSVPLATAVAVIALLTFYSLWFGFTFTVRQRREREQGRATRARDEGGQTRRTEAMAATSDASRGRGARVAPK